MMKYSLILGSALAAISLSACAPNYYPRQAQFMQPAGVSQNIRQNAAAYPTVNFAANGCRDLYETKGYNCAPPQETRIHIIQSYE